MRPTSAYIHVPFCRHRCGYCNFTLIAKRDDLVPSYLRALELEISHELQSPQPMRTLFLGGGTPSHLQLEELDQLLYLLKRWLPLETAGEFSCEMNPADCSNEKLELLASHGVNRISLGGQSFSNRKLNVLERDHTGNQLQSAIKSARRFIPNVSLDLIFAAPQESLDEWLQDLAIATSLPISHLSTYGLTIEKGSAFYGNMTRGALQELEEELQLSMYKAAIDLITHQSTWEHYEVSSFANQGNRCLHNQVYWQGNPWYGFGPGAASLHSTEDPLSPLVRRVNHRSTSTYIKRLLAKRPIVEEESRLNSEQAIREQVVFGLRMLDGVCLDRVARRWQQESVRYLFEPYLSNYVDQGWLEQAGSTLSLTRRGLMISDSLWPDLLGD